MIHCYRSTFLLIFLIWISTILNLTSPTTSAKPYRRSFINPYPRFEAYHDNGDPGQPLFLTPMIEANNITAARQAAEVHHTNFQNVTSYSGFLTVDQQYKSNLFFWYFPAEHNQTYAPVVLWLQGGPGASSLFGLFQENGPFEFKKQKLQLRSQYSWSTKMNLIYIDNPVGTGFSFTENDKGYAQSERHIAENLQKALKQLFKLFDFELSHGFWITGESYAGKYIPALAYFMHKAQNSIENDVFINLKGVAIGNGFSDPLHQLNYGDYLYQLGLIDLVNSMKFKKVESQAINCIHDNNMTCAFELLDGLMNIDGNVNNSLFKNVTGFQTYYNYLVTNFEEGNTEEKAMGEFLQLSEIRRALHVGNMTFHDSDEENEVEKYLRADIMVSVAPWVAEILEHYKVCIYNGQLDIIVAYPLTENYLQKLKFSDAYIYKIAPRQIWRVDSEVAGYKKEAGNLLEVMVRNAGHMVPRDQPKWMFDLITDLTGTK